MIVVRNFGWTLRDKKARSYYKPYEIFKNILKSLLSTRNYPFIYKFYFSKMFYIFPKISSISIYKNSCLFSKYGRVVFKSFKLSRHFGKYFASNGYLLGFRKASF